MMVAWYKHDIPAWTDGTASLSDGAYRVYHVICQQIYLNEGPIAINERYLAGCCNQSLKAFRIHLKELIGARKLAEVDSRLTNSRAILELSSVENNRKNAGKGGKNSGKSSKSDELVNENNGNDEASLKNGRSLKTREEKKREEKNQDAADAALFDLGQPPPCDVSGRKVKTDEADLFDRGKAVLGKSGGGLIKKLLTAKGGNIALARAAVEQASTKSDPREYLGAIIRGREGSDDLRARGDAW